MNHQLTAESVLRGVGGAANVVAVEHCSTRLRFNLADDSKADIAALKDVPGVLGVVNTGQTQVIIGNDVIEIYDALVKLPGVSKDGSLQTVSPCKGPPQRSQRRRDRAGLHRRSVPAAGAGPGRRRHSEVLSDAVCGVWVGWTSRARPTSF